MKKCVPFTFGERQHIEEFIKSGVSIGQIAKYLGRSKSGVKHQIERCGGRENYTAKEAEKTVQERKLFARKSRQDAVLGMENPTNKMKKRIENLEMQMEILIDQIKELANK